MYKLNNCVYMSYDEIEPVIGVEHSRSLFEDLSKRKKRRAIQSLDEKPIGFCKVYGVMPITGITYYHIDDICESLHRVRQAGLYKTPYGRCIPEMSLKLGAAEPNDLIAQFVDVLGAYVYCRYVIYPYGFADSGNNLQRRAWIDDPKLIDIFGTTIMHSFSEWTELECVRIPTQDSDIHKVYKLIRFPVLAKGIVDRFYPEYRNGNDCSYTKAFNHIVSDLINGDKNKL